MTKELLLQAGQLGFVLGYIFGLGFWFAFWFVKYILGLFISLSKIYKINNE